MAFSKEQSATFKVRWYDVGEAALAGRPGVIDVQKGWKGFSEINSVTYDDNIVQLESLEQWVKESGTYLGTIEYEGGERGEK